MLRYYVRFCRFGSLFFCGKEDIPCRKTFTAKVLTWDACLPQRLLKDFFSQPHQPFCFKVGNDQREDSWGNFIRDFWDGQYFIAFEVLGKSAHPVFLVFFRSSLLAFPGCGAFLGRLNRAVLGNFGFLYIVGDRQRRPI